MATTPIAGAVVTPCDDGGRELVAPEIRVRQADVVNFAVHVCNANAHVNASVQSFSTGLERQLLATRGQMISAVTLPSLPPGRYALMWNVLTPAATWQTRATVVVNGTTVFLRRKSDASSIPVNMGFLNIEVVS